jgi:hypothetical protein
MLGQSGNRFGLILFGIQLSVVAAFVAMATSANTLAEDMPADYEPEDGGIEITAFETYVDSSNLLSVFGTIEDENPESATAKLTFLGEQHTLSVGSSADFSWFYQLGPGDEGTLSVVATDHLGNTDTAEDYIIPNP